MTQSPNIFKTCNIPQLNMNPHGWNSVLGLSVQANNKKSQDNLANTDLTNAPTHKILLKRLLTISPVQKQDLLNLFGLFRVANETNIV